MEVLQLDSGCYGENERKMKIIGRVFTVYCILVIIKHLVMICKVAILLQITPEMPEDYRRKVSAASEIDGQKKSYISSQECLLFSSQFH